MRRLLALFPVDRVGIDRAAEVIASIPRAELLGYFFFAAIIVADLVVGALLLGGDL